MAILRKRNKLTALIGGKHDLRGKDFCDRQSPAVGKYQLEMQVIGACSFLSASWFWRTPQCYILYERNQTRIRQERGNVYSEAWELHPVFIYLKNTIFHSIQNLGLSVLSLSCMKKVSDSLPLMHFKIWQPRTCWEEILEQIRILC